MAYINGYAEKMPFKSESIDIITSINSIDHVSSLTDSVNEIHRVLKKGGVFLLATDIHAHPTPTEPVSIPWDFAKKVSDKFSVVNEWHYEVTPGKEGGLLAAYKNGELYDHTNKNDRYGALILHLVKV